MPPSINFRPLITAGTVLGIGVGGFFDGILFHQILQLHNMLSNKKFPDTIVALEINMFWDGLFHAFTWTMVLVGLSILWRAMARPNVPKSTPILVGSMLFGWGIFNLVEGIIDHQLLQLHHVVQRASNPSQFIFDMLFLISGAILIVAGRMLINKERIKIVHSLAINDDLEQIVNFRRRSRA